MPTDTALIRRASSLGGERLAAAESLFVRLGWKGSLKPVSFAGRNGPMLDLLWAGEPQAVVLLTASDDTARPMSLGYSREARYVVLWTPAEVTVQDPRRWAGVPGDAPFLRAASDAPNEVLRVLEHLRPTELLEDAPGLYASSGSPHKGLAELLGDALGDLRMQVADAGLMRGQAPEERDSAVLRLFHQLLFIRFQEDRGDRASEVVLSELDPEEDLHVAVGTALRDYGERLNSELFASAGISVEDLPKRALGDVIGQLVEPWAKLRLDFSVSRTEIAGRLYQSYLRNLPKREPEGRQTSLLPRAHTVDERERDASYYTPPALARYVVDEALGGWLKHHRPQMPQDVRVLDPACGSGAFLIAAYRGLLAYFATVRGRTLSASEREEVLLASIYGSDVDERALGLAQVQLLEEAHLGGRLPRLGENLLQGDALPAPPGVPARRGQIDWGNVLDRLGGPFDVLVANPPFGSQVKLPQRLKIAEIGAVRDRYPEVKSFGQDYAYFFLALAWRLLGKDGAAGLVLPRTLLDGDSGRGARDLLAKGSPRLLVDFRGAQLFDVKGYVCVAVLGPGADVEIAGITDSRTDARMILDQLAKHRGNDVGYRRVTRGRLAGRSADGWSAFRLRWELELRRELSAETAPLIPDPSETRIARYGTKPGALADFLIDSGEWAPAGKGRVAVGAVVLEERYAPLVVRGENISPFHIERTGRRIFLPFEEDGKTSPREEVRAELGRRGGLPRNVQHGDLRTLRGPKLILRALAREPATVADVTGEWMPLMGTAGGIAVRLDDVEPSDLPAYEALLNSAFHQWLIHGLGRPKHDESVELTVADVERLPIPAGLDRGGVERLSAAGEAVRSAYAESKPLKRMREYRDARLDLDSLVYELMGVPPRLRAIVADELIRIA
jgi:N-6 DNA Methylase